MTYVARLQCNVIRAAQYPLVYLRNNRYYWGWNYYKTGAGSPPREPGPNLIPIPRTPEVGANIS